MASPAPVAPPRARPGAAGCALALALLAAGPGPTGCGDGPAPAPGPEHARALAELARAEAELARALPPDWRFKDYPDRIPAAAPGIERGFREAIRWLEPEGESDDLYRARYAYGNFLELVGRDEEATAVRVAGLGLGAGERPSPTGMAGEKSSRPG